MSSTSASLSRPHPALAPLLGLVVTIVHAAFVLLATGERSAGAAYRRLLQWDALWYASIVDQGYQCDLGRISHGHYSCNCGFYPGLPVLAMVVRTIFGLPTWLALPLMAQLCCWGLWTYVLLLMRRWGVRAESQAAAIVLLVVHPWSFFLHVGYSEAPFLCFLTGYLYWSDRPGRVAWVLAAVHGIGMTATRLVGLMAVPWPVLRRLGEPLRPRGPAVLLSLVACSGMGLFYGYLALRFGRFDLYHQAQWAGWSVVPDYLVFLRWDAYCPLYTNGIVSPILVVWAGWMIWREWQHATVRADRAMFWSLMAVGGLLFYLAMAAMINRQLCSLPRISYPSVVLFTLAWAHQGERLPRAERAPRRRYLALASLAFAVTVGLALQVHFVQRFIHRRWVA